MLIDFNLFSFGALQKGPSVADTVIGEGNTNAWKLCGLDKSTCLTVFFDLSSTGSNPPGTVNPQFYLQFVTRYSESFCLSRFFPSFFVSTLLSFCTMLLLYALDLLLLTGLQLPKP